MEFKELQKMLRHYGARRRPEAVVSAEGVGRMREGRA